MAITGSMYGATSLNFTQASLYVVQVGSAGVEERAQSHKPQAAGHGHVQPASARRCSMRWGGGW